MLEALRPAAWRWAASSASPAVPCQDSAAAAPEGATIHAPVRACGRTCSSAGRSGMEIGGDTALTRPCARHARNGRAVQRSFAAGGPAVRAGTGVPGVVEGRSTAGREIARHERPPRRSKGGVSCSRTGVLLTPRASSHEPRKTGNAIPEIVGETVPPLDGYDLTLKTPGLNVNRLEDIVNEVERHICEDNLDGAARVLGTSRGKIERFSDQSPITGSRRRCVRTALTPRCFIAKGSRMIGRRIRRGHLDCERIRFARRRAPREARAPAGAARARERSGRSLRGVDELS